ncbi:MAG: 2-C-methyl-D-erythritol 2,4-cyclodiphosphate synthase [Clostridia bacterium]|nr:2-C-methyl-D-erythritol 2,4-cyclodiphosphate synthase [Clostridia bacterium]
MGMDKTKQRISICGESVLRRSVKAFCDSNYVSSVIVVVKEDEIAWASEELQDLPKIDNIIIGGKNRAESAFKGFSATDSRSDFVAIHDGARCLVTQKMIDEVISSAILHDAATAACRVNDTLKQVGADGAIDRTIPRDCVYSAQTPQVFSCDLYRRAMTNVAPDAAFTDDNMLIEAIGQRVFVVDTGRENIKITTSEDLAFAEYIIKRRREMEEFRVGHGYDVHRLVEGRALVLGGVQVPHTKGLLGHSDADVLTHAVMDAILGAASLGDIGRHFPDTSDEYKDISSLRLLERVAELVNKNGYSIVNIDITLIAQKPKIAPFVDKMIENISNILNINQGRINIKATTEEKLGFTGNEEGVSCHAVAMLKNKG